MNIFRFVIFRFPRTWIFVGDVVRTLGIPLRLLLFWRYRRQYRESMMQFQIGDVVRVHQRDDDCRVLLSPLAQEQLGETPRDPADEYGAVEWKLPTPAAKTITHSLFEQHEPWVVDGIDQGSMWNWLYMKIVQGAVNRTPGGIVLRPFHESMIAWPEITWLGKNKVWVQREILELYPTDELEKVRREFLK